ncbi:MAG: YncE family protein [Acidimicrobiales bacterium]|nr:YncE family protein [Acidimicrobiales bacterium]
MIFDIIKLEKVSKPRNKFGILVVAVVVAISLSACSHVSQTVALAKTTLYVADPGENTIYPVSVITKSVAASISVGKNPSQLLPTPQGISVYAVTGGSETISRFDPLSINPQTPIKTGVDAFAMAISPHNNGWYGYLISRNSGVLTTVDLLTDKVTTNFVVGIDPTAIAISNSGLLALVTDGATNTLNVIDLISKTIKLKIQLPGKPTGVIVAPTGFNAYVTIGSLNEVLPIDMEKFTLGAPIHVGNDPTSIMLDAASERAYVVCSGLNAVTPINLATELPFPSYIMGSLIGGITVSADGTTVFVSEPLQHRVVLLNAITGSVDTTIPLDFAPGALILVQ